MTEEAGRAGLFASLKGLLGTAVTLLHNRLELLGVELAEERGRLVAMLVWGAVALISLGAGLVFVAMFLTVLFWDSHRLLVLGVFSALFVGGGLIALKLALGRARESSRLFAASLAELRRDGEALVGNPASKPPAP